MKKNNEGQYNKLRAEALRELERLGVILSPFVRWEAIGMIPPDMYDNLRPMPSYEEAVMQDPALDKRTRSRVMDGSDELKVQDFNALANEFNRDLFMIKKLQDKDRVRQFVERARQITSRPKSR